MRLRRKPLGSPSRHLACHEPVASAALAEGIAVASVDYSVLALQQL